MQYETLDFLLLNSLKHTKLLQSLLGMNVKQIGCMLIYTRIIITYQFCYYSN